MQACKAFAKATAALSPLASFRIMQAFFVDGAALLMTEGDGGEYFSDAWELTPEDARAMARVVCVLSEREVRAQRDSLRTKMRHDRCGASATHGEQPGSKDATGQSQKGSHQRLDLPISQARVQLTLNAHFPKVLCPGAKTARASRFPYEPPLISLTGFKEIERRAAVLIKPENKRRALTAINAAACRAADKEYGAAGAAGGKNAHGAAALGIETNKLQLTWGRRGGKSPVLKIKEKPIFIICSRDAD